MCAHCYIYYVVCRGSAIIQIIIQKAAAISNALYMPNYSLFVVESSTCGILLMMKNRKMSELDIV